MKQPTLWRKKVCRENRLSIPLHWVRLTINMFARSSLGAELKEQASEKVDQAKDKANEVASDAKKKGEGKSNISSSAYLRWIHSSILEVKKDVQQKGKRRIVLSQTFSYRLDCLTSSWWSERPSLAKSRPSERQSEWVGHRCEEEGRGWEFFWILIWMTVILFLIRS